MRKSIDSAVSVFKNHIHTADVKLIVVSGMLGVGKTSVLLKLIDKVIAKGYKVVVIENEVGSKGVDGELINIAGTEVLELGGGCICCTMKSSLMETLMFIDANINPDIVIVEPSGIADPKHIVEVTEEMRDMSVSGLFTVIVADSERFSKMAMVFERPMRNQLDVADLVLLNKIDTRNADELNEIEQKIRDFGYKGEILRIRADIGENMERIPELIL